MTKLAAEALGLKFLSYPIADRIKTSAPI